MLLVGITILALSSVLAAVSESGDLLIGSRVLQGVGGAIILPTTLSIIDATFRGKDRAISSFRNGNIAAMTISLGEYGIILSLPLWLQNVLGYDALQTGFVILALAIVGLVISSETPWWAIAIGLFVYGFSIGLATAQLTGVIFKDVPIEQSSQGSGTQSTSRQVGSALGIAILGTILFTSVGASLEARLADSALPNSAKTQVVNAVVDSAGNAIPGLADRSPDVAADARDAFSDGTRYSTFAAAGFLALGLLATLRFDGRRPEGTSADVAELVADNA